MDLPTAGNRAIGPQIATIEDLHVASSLVGDLGLHFPAGQTLGAGTELPKIAGAEERVGVDPRLMAKLGGNVRPTFHGGKDFGEVGIAVSGGFCLEGVWGQRQQQQRGAR